MNFQFKKLLLLAGDIIVLYLSLFLALLIRYQSPPAAVTWQQHFSVFTLIFFAWLIVFYIFELYNLNIAINNAEFLNKILRAVAIAGLIAAFYFYINPKIGIAPKTNLAIYLVVFTLLMFAWRRFFNWSLNSYLPKENIAFIGYNSQIRELVRAFSEKPHLGYRIALIFHNSSADIIGNIPFTSNFKNLKNTLSKNHISTVVLASDPHQSMELRSALFACLPLKINFITLPNFYEAVTGKVPIEAINQMWFLENLSEGKKKLYDIIKRAYDLALSLAILVLTALFWPLIGIIIKLESPGPIFFMQTRAGRGNRAFKLIKFRTMREENNDRALTKKNDSRITGFGKILRKTRIDELPQILNILLSDMSFIGPRPERPELIQKLQDQIPFYHQRSLIKPGLTGWDQVSGEYHSPTREDTLKKLQFDLFYIKNRSIYLDLTIILRTIATVFSRAGI